MLTDVELAEMQAMQETVMPSTATITHYVDASDGMGGSITTETTATSPCRLSPTKNMPVATVFAGRLAERLPWRCTFPAGTAVTENDTITVDGRIFDVIGALGPYSLETALVCILAEHE